jgi:ABC-type sugar transport system permease subunit
MLSRLSYRRQNALTYGLFLAVPLLLFTVGYVYPVISTVIISLHDWDGISPTWTFVGPRMYLDLLHQDRFWHSLANNFKWLIFYLAAPTALGLGLALLVEQKIRGAPLFKIIFFLPFTMTPIAVATIWRWLYDPNMGIFTVFLQTIGLESVNRDWLGEPTIVTYAIMLANLWWFTGFSFLVYFAGLRSLPTEYIDAARIDGASPWTLFWQIKFPLLWPSTIVVLGIAGVEAMRIFDMIWGMTKGGPFNSSDVLATQMYETSFARFDMGQGSAVAVCLMMVSAVVILPFILYMARFVDEIHE